MKRKDLAANIAMTILFIGLLLVVAYIIVDFFIAMNDCFDDRMILDIFMLVIITCGMITLKYVVTGITKLWMSDKEEE
jgi:hypothetical protein